MVSPGCTSNPLTMARGGVPLNTPEIFTVSTQVRNSALGCGTTGAGGGSAFVCVIAIGGCVGTFTESTGAADWFTDIGAGTAGG